MKIEEAKEIYGYHVKKLVSMYYENRDVAKNYATRGVEDEIRWNERAFSTS